MSKSTGINASHALKWEDKDDLVEIVRSMAHMESGIIEDKAIIEEAYDLAKKKFTKIRGSFTFNKKKKKYCLR